MSKTQRQVSKWHSQEGASTWLCWNQEFSYRSWKGGIPICKCGVIKGLKRGGEKYVILTGLGEY